MRAVVTGGAGFLGSHLCDRLLKEGWEVLALDNLITGAEKNVAHLQGNGKFKFEKADVSEPLRVEGDVAYVLHFASPDSLGGVPTQMKMASPARMASPMLAV